MGLIRGPHHMRGKHSCRIRRWFLSRVRADEQPPSQRRHHRGQVIASLRGHGQHKGRHEEISQLLQEQVDSNHEGGRKQFNLHLGIR